MVRSAHSYTYYRKNWNRFSIETLGRCNKERTINHDSFIEAINSLSRLIEEESISGLVPWRVALGNDRKIIGDFAEYIIDRLEKAKERIEILESIKWAQEHQNQVYYIVEHALDSIDLYVYGIGMMDVEFSKDIYTFPKNVDDATISIKDVTLEPAIEIVLRETPRGIERKAEEVLLFKDIKPYLQIGRNFAVVNREDWSYRLYEWKRDIPEEYDDKFVFGIGMEDNFDENDKDVINILEKREYDSYLNKRMVIVLSDTGRADIDEGI